MATLGHGLVLISGCSGGGKSTLLAELARTQAALTVSPAFLNLRLLPRRRTANRLLCA